MNPSRRTFGVMAGAAVAVAGTTRWLLSQIEETDALARSRPGTGSRLQQRDRHFPNVSFRTQDNRRVRFYDDVIKGKKVLINFMYTECDGTCPRTTSNLVKVHQAFGDRMGRDVFFASISLTPDRDTPARLKAYAAEQRCGAGWLFLTGDIRDVDRVRRRLGVYDAPDISQHLGLVTFGNEATGKWGATSTLASADEIVWVVKSRIDDFTAEPWPARTPGEQV